MTSKLFSAVVAMVLCFLVLGSNADARDCKKGKPCGNSCISKNDVCHKDETTSKMAPTAQEPASAPAATPRSEAPAAAPVAAEAKSAATKEKSCKKGKPCGNSCIPKDAVCHQ